MGRLGAVKATCLDLGDVITGLLFAANAKAIFFFIHQSCTLMLRICDNFCLL